MTPKVNYTQEDISKRIGQAELSSPKEARAVNIIIEKLRYHGIRAEDVRYMHTMFDIIVGEISHPKDKIEIEITKNTKWGPGEDFPTYWTVNLPYRKDGYDGSIIYLRINNSLDRIIGAPIQIFYDEGKPKNIPNSLSHLGIEHDNDFICLRPEKCPINGWESLIKHIKNNRGE